MKTFNSLHSRRREKSVQHNSPFDKDADGVCHELVGHLQNFMWKCGRDEKNLCSRRQIAVDIIDLFFEAYTRNRPHTVNAGLVPVNSSHK